MKKSKVLFGVLFSTLILAGGVTTAAVSKESKPIAAKADVELNDSFDKIYSDAYNNTSFVTGFNQVLLCFAGTPNGLTNASIYDASVLNNILINGKVLYNTGGLVKPWGSGQNWFTVVYPNSLLSGEGTTLEIKNGTVVGDSVIAGVKFVMDSNSKWQFDSYVVEEVETDVLALNPNYWGFVVFQLSGYTGTQAHTISSASKCLSNDIYVNGDPDSKLLQAGPTWNTLAAPSNANYFGWDPSALSDSLDNISSITIPAGTKFPSTSFVDQSKGDGYRLYVTTEDVVFKKKDSSWVKLNLIKNDELVKNGDYTLFTPSDFNNGSNSTWPFFIQKATQLSDLNFGLQFNLNLTEEQIGGYQTLRLGTTLTGNEYFELLINYKANTYINKFNGVAGNIPSSIASISVTANEEHLFELYSFKVSENSVRILLGIDGILIFKTDALDATGASCSAIALFSGTVANADQAYSACETTTISAINRFGVNKLKSETIPFDDNRDTGACLTDYAAAKSFYENYLTNSQKAAFVSEDDYANLRARLSAWAAANGETFNASGTGSFSSARFNPLFNDVSDASTIVIIVTSAIMLGAAGFFFLFRKKKER